jgi:magnesium-transporting ATPase (P-type)
MFYKNMAFTFNQFIYGIFSSFSGGTVYDSILFMIYNVIFTSVPPVIFAAADRDLKFSSMTSIPELYWFEGNRPGYQSYGRYWLSQLLGMVHGLICFFVPFFGMRPYVDQMGLAFGLPGFGTTVYASVVVIANLRIATMCRRWTILHFVFIFGSIFVLPVVMLITEALRLSLNVVGSVVPLISSSAFYVSIVGCVLLAMFPMIGIEAVSGSLNSLRNRVRLGEKKYEYSFEATNEHSISSASFTLNDSMI